MKNEVGILARKEIIERRGCPAAEKFGKMKYERGECKTAGTRFGFRLLKIVRFSESAVYI